MDHPEYLQNSLDQCSITLDYFLASLTLSLGQPCLYSVLYSGECMGGRASTVAPNACGAQHAPQAVGEGDM